MTARIKQALASRYSKGFGEGAFVASLTELGADAVVQFAPWFQPRRLHVVVILGAVIGSLVHHVFARFIWRPARA